MMVAPSTPQRQLQPFIMQPSASPAVGPSSEQVEDDDENGEDNIFRDMSFDEVLEDLNARFLANLPEEEMTLVRLYWQAEQAHWFYEDYLRPLNPLLPSLSQRQFTHLIIASSPLYDGAGIDYDAVWEEYCAYKKMVPCCGGILINATHDKVLMVRGWKTNAGWCFPRGKINSEESDVACAIREVEEETGFDLSGRINPDDFIKTQINAQEVTMFIVKDIDESTVFETQTRKEIGAIEWVPFLDLPTWAQKKGPKRTGGQGQKKFYNVTPFVGPLKKWLQKRGINSYPKRRVEAVPATRQRDLQPFTFDDMPSLPATTSQISHAGHEHPTTALDHLFAKFIQKDDNVTALESDNARTLDQLFGGLDQTPSTQASEDDALAQLLGGLTTVAPPPALPEKQSKLLAVLGGGEQQQQNIHQTNLLSMLSPPKGPRATLAPAVHPSAPLQAPAAGDAGDRHHRQQALLQSMFMGPTNAAPVTPPGPVVLRPQVTASPASGMISPMPPMPPSQAAWQPPPPSGLSGLQSGSPLRVPPQTPPQMPRTGPPAHLFTPPAHVSPQQAARVHPQYSPQQYAQTSPRPPVNNHQRALLGTLFNANRPMQGYNGPGIGAPSNMPPMANGRPPNGLPNAYPNPQFVPFQGMPPQGQFSSQSGFFNAPPPFMGPGGHGGPGGPGGPHGHMPPPGMQGMHSHGNQGLQHPRPPGLSGPPPGLTNNESTGPAVPAHPAPQPQALTPGAAVHQPVPRPPVGGGLLGLINGTIG